MTGRSFGVSWITPSSSLGARYSRTLTEKDPPLPNSLRECTPALTGCYRTEINWAKPVAMPSLRRLVHACRSAVLVRMYHFASLHDYRTALTIPAAGPVGDQPCSRRYSSWARTECSAAGHSAGATSEYTCSATARTPASGPSSRSAARTCASRC